MSIQARFQFVHGSRQEMFAALYPFILVGAILPLINILAQTGILPVPNPVVNMLVVALIGLMGLLLISGAVLGLPRWSLPYVGLFLALSNLYLFFGWLEGPVYGFYSDLFDGTSWLGDIFLDGVFWFGLLMAMTVLVLCSTISPKFQRFRKDWTLLCFILYGTIPFAIKISFDAYQGSAPYELFAFFVLSLGAWLYLRSDNISRQFWTLLTAMTISILIVTAAKAILIPYQSWAMAIVESEVKHALIMWGWLVLTMLMPLLLKGLSPTDELSQADD